MSEGSTYIDVKIKFASDNPTNIINKTNPYKSKILKPFKEKDQEEYQKK